MKQKQRSQAGLPTTLRRAVLVALTTLAFVLSSQAGIAAPPAPYLVKDINPTGSSRSYSAGFQMDAASLNGILYFAADDGVNGTELWRSDGTAAGTYLVKDIFPGSNPVVGVNSSYPAYLAVVGGKLYFQAQDATHGTELWASDGTEAGTALVKDINPTGSARSYSPGFYMNMVGLGGVLYFAADDGVNGTELWRSDGTTNGTYMVSDIYPGTNPVVGVNSSYPAYLTVAGSTLYFQAQDATHGTELWRSNGLAAGTTLVKDINPAGSSRSYAGGFQMDMAALNGILYFGADDGVNGTELWRSDGTAAGTSMVKDINPGSNPVIGVNSSYPAYLSVANGRLFFQAQDAAHGTELWASNGTEAGTALVKDINPTGSSRSYSAGFYLNMVPFYNMLYFAADDGTNGTELWRSDGTANGTYLVSDIYPGSNPMIGVNSSYPAYLAVAGRTLFFQAQDATHGTEIWAYRLASVYLPLVRR